MKSSKTALKKKDLLVNLGLLAASLIFTLVLAEIALRLLGFQPGFISKYNKFKPVKNLIVYDTFYTDSEGIYKANPNYTWGNSIRVNADGFRGIPLIPDKSGQPTVLFIGDSFTWGSSATPITDSFVDVVSRNGYVAYNVGIPGTGPTQYAALAEKYVPKLKPDFVAVMFYLGNDLHEPDPMVPYQNLHHPTNAGMLRAYDAKGNYMTPEETYQYYLQTSNAVSIPATNKAIDARIGRILEKTVVGTYLWWGYKTVKTAISPPKAKAAKSSQNAATGTDACKYGYLRPYLEKIRAVSEANGSQMVLFIIPRRPSITKDDQTFEANHCLFDDFSPHLPDSSLETESDYAPQPDDHFINSGHQKYAQFILDTLKAVDH